MDEGYKKDRLLLEQSFQKRIDDVKTKGVRVNEQIEAIEAERSKKLAEFDRKISEQRLMRRLKIVLRLRKREVCKSLTLAWIYCNYKRIKN